MRRRAKIDYQLKRALEKIIEADPDFLLDIVVTPVDQEKLELLVKYMEGRGAKATRVGPNAVRGRIPARQVHGLAGSGLVSTMRLTRLHRMH